MLCTKKVVGYAFSERIDTRLTLAALHMAIQREKLRRDLIFHSNWSAQYAVTAYQNVLAAQGIRRGMSRRGNSYNNAVAENFFS